MPVLASVDKSALLTQLTQQLEVALSVAIAAQQTTMAGATHEESKPENDKDTRALESSYLARGQARRVEELTEALSVVQALVPRRFGAEGAIASTALVQLENEAGQVDTLWLLPAAGGLELSVDGGRVKTITTHSPLGKALIGARLGDGIELTVPGGTREYVVGAVA